MMETEEHEELTKTEKGENDDEQVENLRYGFMKCRPDCLQNFNKPIFFLIVACFVIFGHGLSATGLNNTALTSIEKRYGLSATHIAMFSLCKHISAGIFVLILCHFGHRHRPIAIAIGCCLLCIGYFIISIPQYIVPAYKAGVVLESDTCRLNSTTTATSHCKSVNNDAEINVFPIFLLGYALTGIGVTPLYSLSFAHFEEITSRKSSSWYYAAACMMGISGPAVGFMLANPLLNIYVDIDQPVNSNLKPIDRNWVGAWWLAFVIGSIIMFIPVIPLIGFPNKFSDTERKLKEKRKFKDTVQNDENQKSFIPSLISLLKNKSYMCLSLSISSEFLSVSGTALFLPKFLESQFHLTASQAATSVGVIILPGSLIGIAIGAYICRRFSLNGRQLLIFNIVAQLLGGIAMNGLYLGCDDRDVVGASTGYFNSTKTDLSLQDSCNEPCHCSTRFYKPVCSVHDQKTYYSPCHAGCSAENFKNNHYTNCTCLPSPSSKIVEGRCLPTCGNFPYFMAIIYLITCITFTTEVPFLQATFRLVPEGQGSLAQGLQQMFTRFIGFIPAAPLFGSLIDKSCKLWHTDVCSGKTTSCLEYDNENFRFYFWALNTATKIIAFVLAIFALKFYKLPKQDKIVDDSIPLKEGTYDEKA